MKKVLLGTSALVLAGLMAAPAQAQLEIRVGLDVRAVMSAYSIGNDQSNANPPVARQNNTASFLSDYRLPVTVSGTAENGLAYGATLRLRSDGRTTATQDQTAIRQDLAFVFLGGNWGRLEVGQGWGAIQKNTVFAPVSTVGSWDSGYTPLDQGRARGYVNDQFAVTNLILYQSPNFSGFSVAASYAPENAVGHAFQTSNANLRDTNLYQISAGYRGEFEGIGIAVGGGYAGASTRGTTLAANAPFNNAAVQNLQQWQIGANVSFGGITLGASYWDTGRVNRLAANGRLYGYSLGGTYTMGPWNFNANMINGSGSVGAGGREQDFVYTVGVGYQVAPGLSVGADFQANDLGSHRKVDGSRTQGTAGVAMVRVTF